MKNNLRKWATPLTIGSFILSAITGILIFFHLNIGLVRPAHEWLGWFLIIGVASHLFVNWKRCINYFSEKVGLTIILIFSLLTVLSILPFDNNGKPPFIKAADALIQSPISTVSQVAKRDINEIIANLKSQGITIRDKTQTLQDISEQNQIDDMRLLGAIFDK